MQWLVNVRLETRDVRGEINRKQGMLNYKLRFEREKVLHAPEPKSIQKFYKVAEKNKQHR